MQPADCREASKRLPSRAGSAADPAAAAGTAAAAAAAPRGKGARRQRTEAGAIEASEAPHPNDTTERDNDLPDTTSTKGRKRTKSVSR